jgi:hypothetical protein
VPVGEREDVALAMPPRVSAPPPGEGPLEENVFEFEGNTLSAASFVITDLDTESDCAVDVEVLEKSVIAEGWKDRPPPYPPGVIQYYGTVRVRFTPAVPGHRYRCDGPGASVTRLYRGPEIQSPR